MAVAVVAAMLLLVVAFREDKVDNIASNGFFCLGNGSDAIGLCEKEAAIVATPDDKSEKLEETSSCFGCFWPCS